MAEKWYDKSVSQTLNLMGTDPDKGLSQQEVKKRLLEDGENDIYLRQKKSFSVYIKHLLTDYTSILMLVTLIVAGVFEETNNLFVMMIILVTYYAVAIITYIRSERVLDGVGTTVLPNVKVLRNGKLLMVKQKQLVQGDIFYLSTGDIVPCDARILRSRALEVLEVNVTSYPHAVRKDENFVDYHDLPPIEQHNMMFASSIVTAGTACCICCATGKDTVLRSIGKDTENTDNDQMAVFDRIAAFCRNWTLIMTLFIMAVTIIDLFVSRIQGHGIFESFMTGLSLSVASMSEFYIAFAYIILACGIYNAYDKKKDVNRGALIKNTSKLDKLRSLTCLIVPDDPAFHIGNMTLEKVFSNGVTYSVDDHGYKRNAARVLRYALISTGIYGAGKLIAQNQSGNNIYTAEEEAILSACEQCGEYNIDLEKRYPILQHLSKSSDCRFDTTLVMYEYRFVVAVRGDFRSVLPLCRYYTEDSRVHEMTPEKLNEFVIEAEKLSRESFNVIAIASKDTIYNNLKRLSVWHTEMTFEGFIAVREPVLPEAAKNISRCEAAGIKVIMLTNDISENNVILAESLGILKDGKISVTAYDVAKMNDGLFRANLGICTLYQGLGVPQKRLLVKCLQESGEKVGFLCSELDDIVLMKDADIGFSESITLSERVGNNGIDLQGRSKPLSPGSSAETQSQGCEALKFISDVVVSEADKDGTGGFNAMLDSVLCSKSVYFNLARMIKYMISSQVARLVLVLVSVFAGIEFLLPQQILFCGLVVDFASLIVIAFEKPRYDLLKAKNIVTDKLKQPFKENAFSIAIGVLWSVLIIVSVLVMKKIDVISDIQISSCVFLSGIFTQIAALVEYKRESNIFSKEIRISGAFVLMLLIIGIFIASSFFLQSFGNLFAIYGISKFAWVGIIIPPILVLTACEIYKIFQKK